MLKLRIAVASVAVAALFGGSMALSPAHATHACDPELTLLCTHPEKELEDALDLLCDKSVLIDKILDRFTSCGTN